MVNAKSMLQFIFILYYDIYFCIRYIEFNTSVSAIIEIYIINTCKHDGDFSIHMDGYIGYLLYQECVMHF